MMLRFLALAILISVSGAGYADVPLAPSPTTAVGQAWAEWKAKIPSWADYMPGAIIFKNIGRMGMNGGIVWQKAKNMRAYDRYCSAKAPFAQQPFCMAVTPRLRLKPNDWFARSPLTILLDSLIDRAGPANEASRDAAKLLLTIRTLLEYPTTQASHPDYIIGRLYDQFANCVPNTCQVAVTRPERFAEVMAGMLAYFQTYGGEIDIQAVQLLRQAGF